MRKFNVTVNGKSYEVEVDEMGAAQASTPAAVSAPVVAPVAPKANIAGGSVVESPMPGLILKLLVANGAKVKKGEKIVVLEAMKMENDIVANADGIVNFLVKQGDTVETNAQLASIR